MSTWIVFEDQNGNVNAIQPVSHTVVEADNMTDAIRKSNLTEGRFKFFDIKELEDISLKTFMPTSASPVKRNNVLIINHWEGRIKGHLTSTDIISLIKKENLPYITTLEREKEFRTKLIYCYAVLVLDRAGKVVAKYKDPLGIFKYGSFVR